MLIKSSNAVNEKCLTVTITNSRRSYLFIELLHVDAGFVINYFMVMRRFGVMLEFSRAPSSHTHTPPPPPVCNLFEQHNQLDSVMYSY